VPLAIVLAYIRTVDAAPVGTLRTPHVLR
jgi:hypothetical protein